MFSPENKAKVLIVEDNSELLLGLEVLMNSRGFNVLALDDTEEIWDKIRQFSPDLLLLDVWVEPVRGDQIAHKIDTNGAKQDLPVILISADDSIKQIARQSGAEDYLEKPFDFDHLLDLINQYATQPN
jgi:DNA-binding response OmpR family regulator